MNDKNEFDAVFPVLRHAGEMMLSARDPDSRVHEKYGSSNFVADYDIAVQSYIIGETEKLFPGAVFLAEEKVNDAVFPDDETVFVIDPIDGTTNFMRGVGVSCVSFAAVRGGETVFGAVYDPYRKEMFHACPGGGAFLNGRPISVARHDPEKALTVFGTSPYYKDTLCDATFELAKRLFLAGADVRRTGSAALDLACVASGRYDLFFEMILQPWDIAAGILLIREAGGVITTLSGTPVSPLRQSSILAGSEKVYEAAKALAAPFADGK